MQVAAGHFSAVDLLSFCRYVNRRERVRGKLAGIHSASVAQPSQLTPIIDVAEEVKEQAIRALERGEDALSLSLSITPDVAKMVSWIRQTDYLRFASDETAGPIYVYWAILKALA